MLLQRLNGERGFINEKTKAITGLAALTLMAGLFAGCSSNNNADNAAATNAGTEATAAPEGDAAKDIKGNITVITQRTDIVDTVFKDYAAKFNEQYPNVKVNFEALSTYEDQIKIRMSTDDYGDVLLLPTSVAIKDLPEFFEPLGQKRSLSSNIPVLRNAVWTVLLTVFRLPLITQELSTTNKCSRMQASQKFQEPLISS